MLQRFLNTEILDRFPIIDSYMSNKIRVIPPVASQVIASFAMQITNYLRVDAPRFDAAVHFRNSFRNVDANNPKYQEKVQRWLNDIYCGVHSE